MVICAVWPVTFKFTLIGIQISNLDYTSNPSSLQGSRVISHVHCPLNFVDLLFSSIYDDFYASFPYILHSQ